MAKIKSSIAYLSCAAVGLLNFFWLIIPYVAAFVDTSFGSESEGVSGYKVMSEFWSDFGFGGVMSGLFQIFALVLGVCALAWGVLGLLGELGVAKILPDAIGGFSSKKIAKILLIAFAVVEILLLIFLIVLCAQNTEEFKGQSAGVRFSAGMFISLAFALAGAVLPFVIKEN